MNVPQYIAALPDWWVTMPSGKTFPVAAWRSDGYGTLVPMVPDDTETLPNLIAVDGAFLARHEICEGDPIPKIERRAPRDRR